MPKQSKGIESDILVSCADFQREFTENYLLAHLRKTDLKISYAKQVGGSVQSSNAQMLLGCKVYLPIFCPESVKDTKLKDELALAYISNKAIIPLARAGFRKVNSSIDSGMKLMLAKINWVFFIKEQQFDESYQNLIEVLRHEVKAADNKPETIAPEDEEGAYAALNYHAPGVSPQRTEEDELEDAEEFCEHTEQVLNCDFWERNFTNKKEVLWSDLKEKFINDYQERINRNLGEERVKWMTNILYRDIFDLKKTITLSMYRKFTGPNMQANPDEFYDRLSDYARGSYAMREVFDMDSTVRLTAVQNMASFNTPGVITQLFDLTADLDPNIRAVAALALAKSGRQRNRVVTKLVKMCQDEDRVVRESACLSLAHMKCLQAVPHIVDLWRNDAIKHVREAAELALSRIGGDEANKAMKVTQVLSEEMNNLRSTSATK